jgi:peptidylprolyl isomerase
MPHKLKTSARKSRRNKKIGIVSGVALLVVLAVAAIYFFGQSGPASIPVVQGKVLLQTSMGNITIQLRDDKPITSGNFKNLVQQGKYDGTIFHRVVEGFMIQGGEIADSVPEISDEIGSNNHNVAGTIAMAKLSTSSGEIVPNSATSQFFINVGNNTDLDTNFSVFGNVVQGMDVAMAISHVQVDDPGGQSPKPLQDVTIIKAELLP